MDVTIFSTKPFDRRFLSAAAGTRHRLTFLEAHLTADTVPLARGAGAICPFVNDQVDEKVLTELAALGVRLVALRSAGFNNVDLAAAKRLGITIARVPAYSPEAVSEYTVALILALDRNLHRAYARVREGNFSLDGLMGFNLAGRTVGIVGTGRIGAGVARIMKSFGCRIVAHDLTPNPACVADGVTYMSLAELLPISDIVSLHCPLLPSTRHMIDKATIATLKHGMMLINTSRGGLIETTDVIEALKAGTIAQLGLDVYEEEGDLFFEDLSDQVIRDDVFSRLLTFPNVLITGHQAFFTVEALTAIAETTMANLTAFETTGHALHEVT
ncbi:2-hydroxyacid dehydrogenase [Siculibacillus lacustris]|uniref:2-hydroxyacid dehydrogenase n=1 Tax=Siculibacillus lacustris TaxID=1549641 RepID=A0A4Q9VPM7_9HYPH|nr:2-hydroxyacid dehydrogenase [Siculibacillus lacustris]TBW36787.1 2-hydroxyacid dehydrogenase [Siculibacillus lacustris]